MLWVDKYRPIRLDEFKGHDSIKSRLEQLSCDNLPHLLMSGPPGSGKSSAMNVLTRTLYADMWQKYTLIINASDSRNIKTIRENYNLICGKREIRIYVFPGQTPQTRDLRRSRQPDTRRAIVFAVFDREIFEHVSILSARQLCPFDSASDTVSLFALDVSPLARNGGLKTFACRRWQRGHASAR